MTMKERITASVAQRLALAAEGQAKDEIIEELSGNLYAKYEDLVKAGADPEEAYGQAMDSLGDVSELIALAGGPRGRAEFERTVDAVVTKVRDVAQELKEELKGPVKEAYQGVKQAAQAAKEPLKDMGRSIAGAVKNLEITVDVRSQHQFDYTVDAGDITGLELRLRSGDVVFRLWDEPVIQVIERSSRTLDEDRHASFLRREDGVLCIEQGSTAVGFAFFNFGVFASDFEVFLPRRLWESVSVYSTNGDVALPDALEVQALLVSSTNGDVALGQGLRCETASVTSVNGDLDGEQASIQSLVFRATSGDLDLSFAQLPQVLDLRTVSGDLRVELPENQGFAVAYHQTSGDFDSSFELTTSLSRHDGVASYQGAQSPLYQFTTVSGDITVDRG